MAARSPYIAQCLSPEALYTGRTESGGPAGFSGIKGSKVRELTRGVQARRRVSRLTDAKPGRAVGRPMDPASCRMDFLRSWNDSRDQAGLKEADSHLTGSLTYQQLHCYEPVPLVVRNNGE